MKEIREVLKKMVSFETRAQEWLSGPYDAETKAAIRKLDRKTLEDAFYTDLSFGTGGLRGLMGPGTNRLNIYTIRKTTQGLANYILKAGDPSSHVFIGFDSRHHSQEFAVQTALVLAGNKIPVFLLKEIRPTPFISFGCRYKKCQAAVMITASHNPKEYNGYKVYWSDGAQVVTPHDKGIMAECALVNSLDKIKLAEKNSPLITLLEDEIDAPYLQELFLLQHFHQQNKEKGHLLKISYTSLHGTGITLMPQALTGWGFTSYNFVEKQIIPDGDFPTVKFPNPEYKETLQMGINQLESSQSDILIATDPDADRLAVVVGHQGKSVILTGNQIASICVYFLCQTLCQQKTLPVNPAFVTSIVTTELVTKIAQAYDIPCFETLTGFKYIGEKIHLWETEKNGYKFLFGAEESYGFLLGTYARDKDAIVSGCLMSEIALSMKLQNKTLVDLLEEIYQKFGLFKEKQASFDFKPGKEGLDEIQALMSSLRKTPPTTLCGQKVIQGKDFTKKTKEGLPSSDVLLFRLEDQTKIIVRPSGTEPKIKIYAAVQEQKFSSVDKALATCDKRLDVLLKALEKEISMGIGS
ncbi:MAG: phospho-sugar mutase [Rhabdochlamydiaceae bacterium]